MALTAFHTKTALARHRIHTDFKHHNNDKVVARTCETSSTGMSAGCQSASQGGASADLCYCTSDLCNASTRASITTALLFLLPALLLCFKKL